MASVRTVYNSPCLKCINCKSIDDGHSLDVIEIDGASNNGVDHIRELVENAQYIQSIRIVI